MSMIWTCLERDAVMKKVAKATGFPVEKHARQFDLYYEAQLEGCDPEKNFAVVPGTNGNSWLYHRLIDHYRKQNFCTLVWDNRAHGRSEAPPGEYTAELIAEDVAALKRDAGNACRFAIDKAEKAIQRSNEQACPFP